MSTTLQIQGDSDKKIGAYFAPLSVSAQDTPAMTVKIRAGSFYNSGNALTQYAGGNSPTLTAPISGSKWVLVTLSDAGSVVLVNGANGSSPVLPVVPTGTMVLAAVYVTSTTTSITPALIQDARPFLRVVESTPDIAAELAERPTFTDVANDLALKADVDGTINPQFTLNKNFTMGSPGTDAYVSVKRGNAADVAIRWNESIDQWEFTNDGINYGSFASTSGTFAPIVHTHVHTDITDFTPAVDALIAIATIDEAQVTNLVADLAAKASASAFATHAADTTIHHTLPIAESDVTFLVDDLNSKANLAGAVFTGNVTVHGVGKQPIMLASVDSGSSGLTVDRSSVPAPNAQLEWDESSGAWLCGVVGSMNTILTNNIAAPVTSVAGRVGDIILASADITDLTATLDARTLAALADVTVTSPVSGQVLAYNGTDWVNTTIAQPTKGTGTTSDATPLALLTVAAPANTSTTFQVLVSGFQAGTGDTFSTRLFAAFKNFGGTVALVSPVEQDVAYDTNAATWQVTLVPTVGAVDVTVTGEAGKLVDWKATVISL